LTTSYFAVNGGNQLAGLQSNEQKRCIREIINEQTLVLDTKEAEQFKFDFVASENVS
jgi:hypothetical protein